eukprot:TRINITY_DN37786_c0_g1_i1.p1 TRINITY_DN37786_c0_g1~~TRINITY_DN37786_c0_g1_i1.p1  ORF type:complete len:754 (-),score=86.61 TRINITY_DN37786_c0_g1_i1:36-2297(-)
MPTSCEALQQPGDHGSEDGGTRSRVRRIALLGQKDALGRALYEVAQQQRLHPLEVLTFVPVAQQSTSHTADVPKICDAFGFRCVAGADDKLLFHELQNFQPDLIVSILWPRRINVEVLSLCRDSINIHPSLLPRHRGSLTQFWAVFDGDEQAGATCHRMVRDFDAGRILYKVPVCMAPDETALSLSLKIASAIATCFQHVFGLFLAPSGLPLGCEWNVQEFPYHYRRLPRGGIIDPDWDEQKVERFIRAMYFPPHAPAVFIGPDGVQQPVTSLKAYKALVSSAGGREAEQPRASSLPKSVAQASRTTTVLNRVPFLAASAAVAVLLGIFVGPVFFPSKSSATSAAVDANGGTVNIARRYSLVGYPRARCLDGSSPNYYYAPSTGAGRTKWVVYFQGGGWCAESPELVGQAGYCHDESVAHPDLCSVRAGGYHGTSRHDRSVRDLAGKGLLSGEPNDNPQFHDWNRVIVRNCDGTLFLGSADAPLDVSGVGDGPNSSLFFRGRDNVLATLEALVSDHGLGSATEVLLTGCSAGGSAAVVLADWVRAALLSRLAGRVFVAALADSGLFPEWRDAFIPRGVLAFPQFEWIYDYGNASGVAPIGCLEQGLSWRCILADVALAHIHTPVFLLQSIADSWHVSEADDEGALSSLALHLRSAVANSIKPPHGGAVDSCFRHCEQWGAIQWGGSTNSATFQRWYDTLHNRWLRGENLENVTFATDGWPLLHGRTPWVEGCYEGQRRHHDWHRALHRQTGPP